MIGLYLEVNYKQATTVCADFKKTQFFTSEEKDLKSIFLKYLSI